MALRQSAPSMPPSTLPRQSVCLQPVVYTQFAATTSRQASKLGFMRASVAARARVHAFVQSEHAQMPVHGLIGMTAAGRAAGNLRDDIWKCKQAADAAGPPTPFSGMPSGYASGGL